MNALTSEWAAWCYGLGLTVFLLFGLHLWFGWRGTRRGGWLLSAVAASALWCLLSSLFAFHPLWQLWVLASLADAARIGFWIIFCMALLSPEGGAVASSVARIRALVLAAVAARVVIDLSIVLGLGGWEGSGLASIATALACAVTGLVAVEQLYRNFPIESRWGIKPLCLGLAASFFFDIYVFADAFLFRRIDLALWALRAVPAALTMPLVAVSATRSRDWDFRISLSREVAFHTTALALVGGFLLVVAGIGYWVRYFGGEWGRSLQTLLFFASLFVTVIALFSGSLRAHLRVWLSKHFFRYRYDYRSEWLNVTNALVASEGGPDFLITIVRTLADLVESPGGVLWLKSRSGAFIPEGRMNVHPLSAEEAGDGPLALFLRTSGWIIDLEQVRSHPSSYEGFVPPEWVSELPDAWLIVPLFVGEELEGFVVLLTARTRIDVDWEVLDLLKLAGRQAAVQLERMRAAEALLEAQKFDSFNRMSAFVVHDLKNLVAQLQLMLRNADRHVGNPEFQQDMLETVRHVQQRMQDLMGQLQEKRPIDPRRPVDLFDVLRRIAETKRQQKPAIKVSGEPGLLTMAHPERVERVVGHIVQNALDATADEGIVSAEVYADGAWVCTEVRDTGTGMSAQFIRERLFKPFQTTKKAGMGIGAYEALQYINELGGKIDVESEPGHGTRMIVRLPVLGADLASAAA